MTMDPKRRAEAVAGLRSLELIKHAEAEHEPGFEARFQASQQYDVLCAADDELERIGQESGPMVYENERGNLDVNAPGPASSRDVEVLREIATVACAVVEALILEGKRGGDFADVGQAVDAALSAAISALEAKPAKSSSDSMEERIRALEKLLERSMLWLVACPAAEYPDQLVRDINTTLHPHQSWCRGDHSEGACVSDVSEVDRGE